MRRMAVRNVRHIAAGVLTMLHAAALASGLDVAPIQLFLSAERPSSMVSVTNRTDRTRQYQVTLSSWAQSPDGQMLLEDSSALTYFPRMVTLAPGQSRSIRVGLQGKAGALEQTYRVFIEELPSEAAPSPQQIQVLTKIGVPIFVAPAKTESKTSVTHLAAAQSKIAFALKNDGTVHVRPTSIRVTATDARGATVFEELVSPWYVLARSERRYIVNVPPEKCAVIRQLRVLVAAQAETFEASQPTPNGACGS